MGSAMAIIGLHYNLTSVPSHVLPFPFSEHRHSTCETLAQSACCGAQSVMLGFKSSHEPFQFVYGLRHLDRASGVDGYLGIIYYMIIIHLALKNILN